MRQNYSLALIYPKDVNLLWPYGKGTLTEDSLCKACRKSDLKSCGNK